MKIAIIGNMNNNGFALMRYLRDLGADAYLYPFTDDGQGTLAHFRPDNDSWSIEKWRPYIREPLFANGPVSALGGPWDRLLCAWARLRSPDQAKYIRPLSRANVHATFSNFDKVIGSGISPAVFERCGLKLSIFYPYAIGVEFLDNPTFAAEVRSASPLKARLLRRVKELQASGICSAQHVFNAETGITEMALTGLGVAPQRLAVPMVYNRDGPPGELLSPFLTDTGKLIQSADLVVLHHARLQWRQPSGRSEASWRANNKNSDWMLRGFASFRKRCPEIEAKMLIVEYGPDVSATKELADALGVGEHVVWLPKMDRRELTWLISMVHVVCGEAHTIPRTLWGGTGWEALAGGRPLLQGFFFEQGEFEALLGYPEPPLLKVRSETDVTEHLVDIARHPDKVGKIGLAAKEWFNTHNGIALAKQWLDLLSDCPSGSGALPSQAGKMPTNG